MRRLKPRFLWLLAPVLLAGCGGDKATNPNGSGETLILGADPAHWTPVSLFVIERESPTSCYWNWRESTDLGLVLSDDVFGFHGAAHGCGPELENCVQQGIMALLQSTQRIDFTGYADARLRCVLRSGGSATAEGGGLGGPSGTPARCYIRIISNVPGTPGFYVVSQDFNSNDTTDVAIDVSLENALSFREVTIELSLQAEARCSCWHNPCVFHDGTGFIEVRDFRVVGRRK